MAESNDRFTRWQAHTMSQLTLTLSLLSGLSVGGLGLGFALLQSESFKPRGVYAALFVLAMLALIVAAFSAVGAVITRLLDFRLTARKARGNGVTGSATIFRIDATGWGRATWRFFWCASISLLFAMALMCISIANVYLASFLAAAGF